MDRSKPCLLLFLAVTLAASALAQNVDSLRNLKFREIGPATMGGRIDDFAVVESNPNIVYAATASGGVFKSLNSGVTWTPVFDDQSTSTIGDVTVAPSEPDTVWVGTGESNNRQSSSWGNGVYKSQDGGKTWTNMGLKDTHHIGRILVHPRNPNIVYVAAAGHLWGPNEERGVFKSSDGGKTWQKVLYINTDTGVNDIALDPENPDTIFAAAYQRRRTVFGMNGGGPGSAIYRTTDGGANWKKLTNGLPKGELGRIGMDVYRRNGNVVYALVEAEESGLYRSDDKGETWVKMSNTNPRPMYFSQVRIDPNNDQRVWVLGVNMHYSEDGGKSFNTRLVRRVHVDFHAMWIDPANSHNMILGGDGGIHFSRDRGVSWDARENIAIGQFYEIGVDMQRPYNICGGLQDNNTWCGPSATLRQEGIRNDDWKTVQGGDGFYAQIDPVEPWIVYAESQDGNLARRDLRTWEARSIRPREDDDQMARFRFQWNSPVVISRHDRKTLYYGGNYIFKSTDQGDTWKRMSPDVTNNVDRKTLAIMGKKVEDRTMLARNDGVGNWPAVTTLSESAVRAGVMWTGTDDGNVHVSRDGETWKNVTRNIPGVPQGTYVSRVLASAHNPGTAYVTFDGHRANDFAMYIYKTTDFGDTWKSMIAGLPQAGGVLNVVREHPRNPNLLFMGGEHGLYVSFNAGESWQELKNNLPRVPVDDIAIHPRDNDLILGTHGRSIWILDSISALEQITPKTAGADVEVFDPRPATLWKLARTRDFDGHDHFVGQNPPAGAILDVWFKSKPAEKDLKLNILDASGKVVRTLRPQNLEAGVNRIIWNLRANRPVEPTQQEIDNARRMAEAGGGNADALLSGPFVDPGEYTVEVSVGAAKASKKLAVEEDPRITWFKPEERQSRRAALNDVSDMMREADRIRKKFNAVDASLIALQTAWKKPDAARIPDTVKKLAEDLRRKVDEMKPLFTSRGFFQEPTAEERKAELAKPEPAFVLPPVTQRVSQLMNSLESLSAAPSPTQLAQVKLTRDALTEASAKVERLVNEDVVAFNRAMNEAQVPFIHVP